MLVLLFNHNRRAQTGDVQILRRIIGSREKNVRTTNIKLRDERSQNLYSSLSVLFFFIKSKSIEWVENVARMEGIQNFV